MTTSTTPEARAAHPVFAVPGAMDALKALDAAITATGLAPELRELAHLRASQVNGCGVCLVGHARAARGLGMTEDVLASVAGWRDAPWFDERERAALELAEAMTRLADRGEPVPDAVWAAVAEHFDEPQRAALVLTIAGVNLWNRVNVATRQVAGAAW